MPPDAIVISVGLFGPVPSGAHPEYLPLDEFALELPPTTVSTLEGAPEVPEYRTFGRTADYLVEVRASINSPRPSRRLVEDARAVVHRLRLPDWPRLCQPAAAARPGLEVGLFLHTAKR
jgi:hypothetical protein